MLVPELLSGLVLEVQDEVAVVEYLEKVLKVVLVDGLQDEDWAGW